MHILYGMLQNLVHIALYLLTQPSDHARLEEESYLRRCKQQKKKISFTLIYLDFDALRTIFFSPICLVNLCIISTILHLLLLWLSDKVGQWSIDISP